MITARDILKAKGYSDIYSVGPEDSVFSALQLMMEKNIGAVMVTENGKLVGVLSERDYARKVILAGKSSKETKVKEIMTSKVHGVKANATVEECLAIITANFIRHLPVFDGDKLVGLISVGNVVKSIISEQEVLIKHLQDYITGTYV